MAIQLKIFLLSCGSISIWQLRFLIGSGQSLSISTNFRFTIHLSTSLRIISNFLASILIPQYSTKNLPQPLQTSTNVCILAVVLLATACCPACLSRAKDGSQHIPTLCMYNIFLISFSSRLRDSYSLALHRIQHLFGFRVQHSKGVDENEGNSYGANRQSRQERVEDSILHLQKACELGRWRLP